MVNVFTREYPIEGIKRKEEEGNHKFILAFHPKEDNPMTGEVVITWEHNGVSKPFGPEMYGWMSIRFLIPSNDLREMVGSLLRQHYYEYEQEMKNNG